MGRERRRIEMCLQADKIQLGHRLSFYCRPDNSIMLSDKIIVGLTIELSTSFVLLINSRGYDYAVGSAIILLIYLSPTMVRIIVL